MSTEINELTELAYEGGAPLSTTPIVGTPAGSPSALFEPTAEPVRDGEIRVTVLGSGDPFVKHSQASASLLIEVGNPERDLFFFDLGSGALANYNGLGLPVTATTKVFLTHLHADHVGDMPTLVWSLAKAGRRDPVEVWGPAGETPELGTRAYAEHLGAAHAWDMQSLRGHPGQSGAHTEVTEVPWDRTATVYDRNGVRVSSFPVIHILNGSVGYRLDYNGRSVVFSGDTRPCHPLVDACDGADLLIHETFPSAPVFAQKAGVPAALRRAGRQRRAHQPDHGRQGLRPRRRADVGDVAPRRRPRGRRPRVRRHAHRSTRARSRSPRTSPPSTSAPTPSSPGSRSSTRPAGRCSARPS